MSTGRTFNMMKKLYLLGFWLFTLALPTWGATTLRVVDWNFGVNGTGTDGRTDINRVYDALRAKAANADIITCNECYSGTIKDFADRLTRDTGMTWYPITNFDVGSHNHSGIISRYRYISAPRLFNFSVPASMSTGPKTAGTIDVDVNGSTVHVVVTRLCYPCGSSVRATQGRELRTWAATLGEPHIIAGDFNDRVGTTNINSMSTLYVDSYREAQRLNTDTAYSDNPNGNTHGCGTLDYVFVSRRSSITVISSEVPDVRIPPLLPPRSPAVTEPVGCTDDYGVKPSDHSMLKVSLNIPSPSASMSPCDVNRDNVTNISDVQLVVNQALRQATCSTDLNRDGSCNVIDVQRTANAALGRACLSN
jgi:endonuclease/exonuclease/phosphatase family metal-dependent hydrolase